MGESRNWILRRESRWLRWTFVVAIVVGMLIYTVMSVWEVKTTEINKQESKHFILQRTRFFAIYMYSIGMPNCGPQLGLQRSSFVNQIKLVIVLVLFVYITIFTLSEAALVVVYPHQKKHWQFFRSLTPPPGSYSVEIRKLSRCVIVTWVGVLRPWKLGS